MAMNATVVSAQIKAAFIACGASPVPALDTLSNNLATAIIACVSSATVVSTGVAPAGGGPVPSTSTSIT